MWALAGQVTTVAIIALVVLWVVYGRIAKGASSGGHRNAPVEADAAVCGDSTVLKHSRAKDWNQ